MKLKTISLAALLAGIHSASAFSLDFTGLDLDGSTTLSGADNDQLVINVPGFGNVSFGVLEKDVSAVVGDSHDDVAAIEFDDTISITVNFFAGSDVENVVPSFVGLHTGEEPEYQIIDGQSGLIITNKGKVGLSGLTFDRIGPKVPEPSTAFLGCIGAIALLRRRR